MCGRFTIYPTPTELQEFFDLFRTDDFAPRYNVAPTQTVPIIRHDDDGHRVGNLLRWGLIPPWANSAAEGAKMINCRSESAATKPAFRRAFKERRCLVPASGFYEWQAAAAKPGGAKQPWYISPKDAPMFAFAGLFEAWRPHADAEGKAAVARSEEWLLTCCIVTTAPNAIMAPIHDRMSLILARAHWDAWLNRERHDPAALAPLLQGVAAASMQAWPVSRAVNRGSAEGEALIAPLDPPPRT